LLLALVYLRFLRSKDQSIATLISFSATAVGVGLLTSKVLSAQYILWLFPLAFLSGDKRFVWVAALFLATALLTQMLYPFLWDELKHGTANAVLILLLRALALAALCGVLLQASSQSPHTAPAIARGAESAR
jgi:hypothetical protein